MDLQSNDKFHIIDTNYSGDIRALLLLYENDYIITSTDGKEKGDNIKIFSLTKGELEKKLNIPLLVKHLLY